MQVHLVRNFEPAAARALRASPPGLLRDGEARVGDRLLQVAARAIRVNPARPEYPPLPEAKSYRQRRWHGPPRADSFDR